MGEWPWREAKVLIKPSKEEDFYVGWSTIVDGVVWAGSRGEALRGGCPPERLARADAAGTSYVDSSAFGWGDPGLVVSARWWLPRENLAAYAKTIRDEEIQDDEDPRLQRFLESTDGNPNVVTLILGGEDDE